ncbi:CaiB/BaiF CoA transferase family protein [Rhodococcus qingshengii]|uniref:CaiB/BaiF CoA transferase family protein n=1 Tax=Rhodococcus qingshengii TaxID=334542 RepID=UPI0036D8D96E
MTGRLAGPLDGLRVVEMAAMGPVPFCGLVLSDLGADVIRIDRPTDPATEDPMSFTTVLGRGRRSVTANLATEEGRAHALSLIDHADILLEGLRPGKMERLGLGPDTCTARNPRLVYGRMTGFGQDGPLANEPGHDINYLALSGTLHAVGTDLSGPVPPLNLVADFGGGGMLLTVGILAAVHEASRSGIGQVVDAAMVDGAALLTASVYELMGRGMWADQRGTNIFDSGAHFYNTYKTADGKWMAVGAVEPHFYSDLLTGLGVEATYAPQWERDQWPTLRAKFAEIFVRRTRNEWESAFAGTNACVTPVLSLSEAPHHPHNVERSAFQTVDGTVQPSPAPRFSRTPGCTRRGTPASGKSTDRLDAIIKDWTRSS